MTNEEREILASIKKRYEGDHNICTAFTIFENELACAFSRAGEGEDTPRMADGEGNHLTESQTAAKCPTITPSASQPAAPPSPALEAEPVAAFWEIPFNDDADEVQTWKGLALSAIMDLRRYAHDELPSRRLVSAEGYEDDAVRIENAHPPAPQPAQAVDREAIAKLRANLAGIRTPAMGGDNLCISLASYFEPGIEGDEMDDSDTWKQGAIDATNEVLDAIHAHYVDALALLGGQQ